MLSLRTMGSFHVGGRGLVVTGQPKRRITYSKAFADVEYDPNGHYWIEQAYVQYFIPSRLRVPTPLLLVHGGGLTGSVWETTPDGRDGWLPYFLRAGIATYVIDMPERGRAGFCAHEGIWPEAPIVRSEEEAWRLYRFGAPEGFATRTGFPGLQFPLEAATAFARTAVPRWPGNGPMMLAGLEAAVQRIGPCILLGHSQGGGFAMAATIAFPDLVRGCVLVEPHGVPAPEEIARPEPRGCLLVMGDYIERAAEWPPLDAKARAALAGWAEAGGQAEIIELPKQGIFGNSHMPMMDRNSDQVAELILRWLDREHAAGRL
ncbi:alpha/beta fold hydrolase [Rhodoligotrophos defluvii]|uniref:alpha/beta fold hydrolase n=1 Tax=Rhodoligotrophos defluvii TaxID=2561934 RepID=UPI0010C9814E|nr:alpha/beta fold hydrolase [Rhodoligotrophos defluvii]